MAHTPFNEVIKSAQTGKFDDDITTAMQEVVTAVRSTHKPGTLTINLKFEDTGEQIAMMCDVRKKVPTKTRQAALFFPDNDGNLHRKNQMQQELVGLRAGGEDED